MMILQNDVALSVVGRDIRDYVTNLPTQLGTSADVLTGVLNDIDRALSYAGQDEIVNTPSKDAQFECLYNECQDLLDYLVDAHSRGASFDDRAILEYGNCIREITLEFCELRSATLRRAA